MEPKILSIKLQGEKTAYNPTVPFEYEGRECIGIRVESRDSELDYETLFACRQTNCTDSWEIDYSLGSLPLQDPSHVKIKGETFILGVRAWKDGNEMKWQQDIYRGDSIKNLKYFTSGPVGMKDIRLVDLEDKVGVFTRPQGRIGGRGKIGYLEVKNVDELGVFTENDWYNSKIIGDLFDEHQWGGVNQAIRLSGGNIGIIGHIAHETTNEENKPEKHYRGMAFLFNPIKQLQSNFKIIATRKNFPGLSSKKSPELDNVVFPAGIDSAYNLFCGLSDFGIGQMQIENPF